VSQLGGKHFDEASDSAGERQAWIATFSSGMAVFGDFHDDAVGGEVRG